MCQISSWRFQISYVSFIRYSAARLGLANQCAHVNVEHNLHFLQFITFSYILTTLFYLYNPQCSDDCIAIVLTSMAVWHQLGPSTLPYVSDGEAYGVCDHAEEMILSSRLTISFLNVWQYSMRNNFTAATKDAWNFHMLLLGHRTCLVLATKWELILGVMLNVSHRWCTWVMSWCPDSIGTWKPSVPITNAKIIIPCNECQTIHLTGILKTKANTPSDLGIVEFRNMPVCNSF